MSAALKIPPMPTWLIPVKGLGPEVHYVRRGADLGLDVSKASLCNALGPRTSRNVPKWRRVKTARKVCQQCHARACLLNGRIAW